MTDEVEKDLSISKDAAVVSSNTVLNHWQTSNPEQRFLQKQAEHQVSHCPRTKSCIMSKIAYKLT